MNILEVKQLSLEFGGLKALSEIDLSIPEGCVFSVIGPNGAGKTSLFNVISGIYSPSSGSIKFAAANQVKKHSAKGSIRFAVNAAGVGLLLMLIVNIESLWQQVIIDHYTYRQPFPLGAALQTFFSVLWNTNVWYTLFPFSIGFLICFLAQISIGNRSWRSSDKVARSGIARTFQNIRLFDQMSALDNVLVGLDNSLSRGFLSAAFRLPGYGKERALAHQRAQEQLIFVGLNDYASEAAGNLSYGHRRRLEIARALALKPKLLLLDEPAAGLNPSESLELTELIAKIKAQGVGILLIEHHMQVVMKISDRIAVLDYGQKIAEGTPAEIQANPKVIEAYLGKEQE